MENNLKPLSCKNCGNNFQGNYCNICGQKVIHGRFTLRMFFNDLLKTFNIERGFIFTVFQLIKSPGKVLKEILGGKTRNYFSPINYLLVIAGISALLVLTTKSFDNTVDFTTGIAKKYSEDPIEYSESIVIY